MKHTYTDVQILFLESICNGNSYQEITEAFNRKFKTSISNKSMQNKLKDLGLRKGVVRESQYTEAQLTFLYANNHLARPELTDRFNKRFSENKRVDTIQRIMRLKGWGRYHAKAPERPRRISIKGKQIMLDRYVWECVNGPIPPGYTIIHLDNDGQNNKIDNLKLAPSHINSMFVMAGHANAPKALAPALYAKVMLESLIGRIEKSGRL